MIKKYSKRSYYLARILPFMNKDILKVLVGQSYLLFQIMDELIRQGTKRDAIL